MRGVMRLALASSLAVAMLACTPFGTDSSGAPAPDASAEAGAKNLLEGGDFEGAGCTGWSPNEATLVDDPTSRSGKRSCRVCTTNTTPVWSIAQRLRGTMPAGNYAGEAWVRSAPGAQAATSLFAGIDTFDGDTRLDGRETDGPVLTDAWQKIGTSFAVQEGNSVIFAVLSRAQGGCFLVDDATLYRVP